MLNSPLRYPGSKKKLVPFFEQIVTENDIATFVEPFAGGASVGLNLLVDGRIDRLILNDKDKGVSAFWYNAFNHNEQLIKKLEYTPITIDEWHKQRKIYQESKDSFELAFATLFLNRANFSGILKANPVGGINQSGKYKITSRFNKETLIKTISLLGDFKGQVKVLNEDVKDFLKHSFSSNTFIFLDPPYFMQGNKLYVEQFSYDDHRNLAKQSQRLTNFWLTTYDNALEISELYQSNRQLEYNLRYSLRSKKVESELMIFGDGVSIPQNIIFD